jgi:hypothetical protein
MPGFIKQDKAFVFKLLLKHFAWTFKLISFPVVLYWYGTLSLTLREKKRLRVFENRELKEMFAPKRDKSTGG